MWEGESDEEDYNEIDVPAEENDLVERQEKEREEKNQFGYGDYIGFIEDLVNLPVKTGIILSNTKSYTKFKNLLNDLSTFFMPEMVKNNSILSIYLNTQDEADIAAINSNAKNTIGIDISDTFLLADFGDLLGVSSYEVLEDILIMIRIKDSLKERWDVLKEKIETEEGRSELEKLVNKYGFYLKDPKEPKLEYVPGEYKNILLIILKTNIPVGRLLYSRETIDNYYKFFLDLAKIFSITRDFLNKNELKQEMVKMKNTIGVDFKREPVQKILQSLFKDDKDDVWMNYEVLISISLIKTKLIKTIESIEEKNISSIKGLTDLIDQAIDDKNLLFNVIPHKKDRKQDDLSYTDIDLSKSAMDVMNAEEIVISKYIKENIEETVIVIKIVDNSFIHNESRTRYFVYNIKDYNRFVENDDNGDYSRAVAVVFPCLEANGISMTYNLSPNQRNMELDKPLLNLNIIFQIPDCIRLKNITDLINKQVISENKVIGVLITPNTFNTVPSIAKYPFQIGLGNLHCNPGGELVKIWDVHEISNIDKINTQVNPPSMEKPEKIDEKEAAAGAAAAGQGAAAAFEEETSTREVRSDIAPSIGGKHKKKTRKINKRKKTYKTTNKSRKKV